MLTSPSARHREERTLPLPSSLRFAGVIPAPDTADVCYFTERLEKEFALKSCELRISGDDAKACGKLLKGYFKRIVCE